MAWKYIETESLIIDRVYDTIRHQLNQLTPEQAATAKIAVCNQQLSDTDLSITDFIPTGSVPGIVGKFFKLVIRGERDVHPGCARGALFWFDGAVSNEMPQALSGWQKKVFTTSNSYQADLYDKALAQLNALHEQNSAMAINARLSYSNGHHKDATMTLWWPENVQPNSEETK
jgi:hypothetical protein